MNPRPVLLAIYGPTGSGKTSLAEALAEELDARLISADAFQVYRGFDIGTGKPQPPHSWLGTDLLDPWEDSGVVEFIRFALPLLEESWSKSEKVILAGGTGQYLRALLEEFTELGAQPPHDLRDSLDARLKAEGLESLVSELVRLNPRTDVDVKNPVRVRRALEKLLAPSEPFAFILPPFRKIKIGLTVEPDLLAKWQAKRVKGMFAAGWPQEVEGLMAEPDVIQAPAWRAIGYDVVRKALLGQLSLAEAEDEVTLLHRQYAKRQRTWLRKEPDLHCVTVTSDGSRSHRVLQECLSLIWAGETKENG